MAQDMDSQKRFGGTALPAGEYVIHSAFCYQDVLETQKGPRLYDTLEVRVQEPNGRIPQATLRLNGCWRPRKGSDGQAYAAKGNFFEGLKQACTGQTFSEVRNYINSKLIGFKINLSWENYPSQTGFGQVATCGVDTSARVQIQPLPADWQPFRSELFYQTLAKQQQQASVVEDAVVVPPATAAAPAGAADLPF